VLPIFTVTAQRDAAAAGSTRPVRGAIRGTALLVVEPGAGCRGERRVTRPATAAASTTTTSTMAAMVRRDSRPPAPLSGTRRLSMLK